MKVLVGQIFAIGVAVYMLAGNYQFFAPRHSSRLSEAEFQLLDRVYAKHPSITIKALKNGLTTCLSNSIDSETFKFYEEVFVDSFGQLLEFRSQPGLPAVGTSKRQEIDTKFQLDFNESMKKKLSAQISVMTQSQQYKIAQFGNSISGQFGEMSICAVNEALQKLENTHL